MGKISWMLTAMLLMATPPAQAVQAEPGPATIEGRLEIVRADDFATGTSTISYFLNAPQDTPDGRPVRLRLPALQPAEKLRTGDRVRLQGDFHGETFQARSLEFLTAPSSSADPARYRNAPEAVPVMEERRAVILIVDMLDAVNSLDVNEVAGFMYSDGQNVGALYQASSFRQLGFRPDTDGNGDPDVFGPYEIEANAADGCNYDLWASAAEAKARADGIDLSLYQHKVFMLPSQTACYWSGLGTVGCSQNFCRVWVRDGGGPVLAHELGHNLGWHHAGTDPENDGQINSEYGDRSGIMGYPYWSQANAPHRDQLRWFDSFPGSLHRAETSGTFELYPLELDPGVATVGIQVIKIPKPDTDENYYVSYRRRIGDYPAHDDYADKINIHRTAGADHKTMHITNLEQGESFTDDANAITISATATGGETAMVIVTTNTPPAADFSFHVDGRQVQFVDGCSDSDGTVQSWRWDFGDGSQSAEVDPIHTYATGGTYSVTLSVVDDKNGAATALHDVTIQSGSVAESTGTASSSGGGGGGGCFLQTMLNWSGSNGKLALPSHRSTAP